MTDGSRSKRQLNTRCGRTGDAGFSLVELLIAVTILAIIVIPLLHMFVTSTRINVKSRQTLRATTVAQDIMEGLKAYTLEDVQEQFSLPGGTYSSTFFYPSEGFYIVNSSMIQGGVHEIRGLETNRDADGNFEDPDNPDNEIYYFGIQNLKMQGGEYDALIKLDASTYTKDKVKGVGGGSGPSADAHDNYFNGAFYADVTSVAETNGSSEKDSSYHEDPNLSANALKDVKETIEGDAADPTKGITLPANWDEMTEWEFSGGADKIVLTKREINVDLELTKDPSFHNPVKDEEGNFQCTAAITITYHCTFGGKTYTSNGHHGLGDGEVNGKTRFFTSGNFYLFYYPIYAPGKNPIDQITFNVKDTSTLLSADEPLLKSITLAKQIRSTVNTAENTIVPEMSEGKLKQSENDYGAFVYFYTDATMMSDLTFRTNVDKNMSQEAGEDEKELMGVTVATPFNPDPNAPNIRQIAITGENVNHKATNVIYDIEISVYKAGAAQYFEDPDFEDRDDVVRLVKITNLDS